ncbi:MAG TPA: O-antigen ligase family protein [Blastocatellia bacterium]|nr:O-antigen ligase family protein [Blastocatellia bacterium]
MSAIDGQDKIGTLMKGRAGSELVVENVRPIEAEVTARESRGSHGLAFAGLFLFTLLLYARPNELFPEIFGTFPFVKIIAIATLLAYAASKITSGERLTIWPTELKMVAAITLLGVIFIPIASAPQESIDVLLDTFLKVIAIFVLMINLIETRDRLWLLWKLVVVCGAGLSLMALTNYLQGNFAVKYQGTGYRIRIGGPEGFFGNPNDLAIIFVMLIPLAVALALMSSGMKRVIYFASAALLTTGVVVTFSRGGFLGLVATGAVLLWKTGRGNRPLSLVAAAMVLGIFVAMSPGSYANRIISIFDSSLDTTGSGEERRELLERAFEIASARPVLGVGMGNYHIYSHREQHAHNSYLEISAELGVAGLIAFLILIFAPLRSLRRIERESAGSLFSSSFAGRKRENYFLSVTLQAAIIGFCVCAFFASVQYLWFLYFLVAYAISLRRIIAFERDGSAEKNVTPGHGEQRAEGVLWQERRQPALRVEG